MELSPGLLKILSVLSAAAVGTVAVLFLKGTPLYEMAILAAGALFGLPVGAPGQDAPVKALAAKVEAVLQTLRPPPIPPAPYEGPRGNS